MNESAQQLDHPKGMNPKQAMYITLELAWDYYLPWAEKPSKLYLSSWLNRSDNNWQLIADLIEEASRRDSVHDPIGWVWAQLRRQFPQKRIERWVVSTPATA
jgi:hypothetical protein